MRGGRQQARGEARAYAALARRRSALDAAQGGSVALHGIGPVATGEAKQNAALRQSMLWRAWRQARGMELHRQQHPDQVKYPWFWSKVHGLLGYLHYPAVAQVNLRPLASDAGVDEAGLGIGHDLDLANRARQALQRRDHVPGHRRVPDVFERRDADRQRCGFWETIHRPFREAADSIARQRRARLLRRRVGRATGSQDTRDERDRRRNQSMTHISIIGGRAGLATRYVAACGKRGGRWGLPTIR